MSAGIDTGAFASSRTGVVAHFDEARGLGVVRERDGTEHGFHCTAISDGSRAIATGAAVSFRLRPGLLGALEAVAICSAAMLGEAADREVPEA